MADKEGAKPRKKAAEADPASPPRARRSYLRAPERRAQIIAAAQQVFAQSNLKGARTRDIAKAAKVNQATLFEHFASKEELFEEAVVKPLLDTMRGMNERIPRYAAAATLEEMQALGRTQTQRQIETMFDIFPLLAAALFSDLEQGKILYREQVLPLLRARAEAIAPLTRDSLDPETVEFAVFGTIFALAMHRNLSGAACDPARLAEQVATIITTGFARPRGEE